MDIFSFQKISFWYFSKDLNRFFDKIITVCVFFLEVSKIFIFNNFRF